MYQGQAEDEYENDAPFDFDPQEIDFMLLTHAHIDHSGRIPKLYNEGFRNKIYAHKATCDLCSLMLPDSRTYPRNGSRMEKQKKTKKRRKAISTIIHSRRCCKMFRDICSG